MPQSTDHQSVPEVRDAQLLEWKRTRSLGVAVFAGLGLCYAWLFAGIWAHLLIPDASSSLMPTIRFALALMASGLVLGFLAGVISGRSIQRDHLTTAVVFASIANMFLWCAYRFLFAVFDLGGRDMHGCGVEPDLYVGTWVLCGAIFCSMPAAVMLAHFGRKLVNTRWPRRDREQVDAPSDEVDVLDETD